MEEERLNQLDWKRRQGGLPRVKIFFSEELNLYFLSDGRVIVVKRGSSKFFGTIYRKFVVKMMLSAGVRYTEREKRAKRFFKHVHMLRTIF